MNQIKEQIIMQCYHCGNKGLMNVVNIITQKFGGTFVNSFGDVEHEFEEHYTWKLLLCPVCHMPTLYQTYTDESMEYEENQGYDIKILYPEVQMDLTNVPEIVASNFESALRIKNINKDMCLTALRKTLEMICLDKNARGNSLESKIKNLVATNVFPKELDNAYYLIRKYGNAGTHSKNVSAGNYEVEELIRILYDVINYLYMLPVKLVNMKSKYDSSNHIKEKNND